MDCRTNAGGRCIDEIADGAGTGKWRPTRTYRDHLLSIFHLARAARHLSDMFIRVYVGLSIFLVLVPDQPRRTHPAYPANTRNRDGLEGALDDAIIAKERSTFGLVQACENVW